MSTGDLPEGTAGDGTLSFDEGVSDISNLLDPATDLQQDQESDKPAEAEETDTAEASEEGEEAAEGSEDEANADEDDQSDDEDQDGPDKTYSGGKFAADDAKVTLDDGTTITVGELRRNNLFQRDYTRKTEELKAERQQFESVQKRVDEVAQSLVNQREFLQQLAQKFLPTAPTRELLEHDPVAYINAKADYDERVAELNQLHQFSADAQAKAEKKAQDDLKELKASEQSKLLEAMPELRDRSKAETFFTDMTSVGQEYGFTAEELGNVMDHRIYKVLRDVIAFKKLKNAVPKAKEAVQNKPPLIKGGKRMDPKARDSRERQAADERLRKTGSLHAGIEALMNLDL